MGWDVLYALPLFHLPTEVINNRQHLLPITLFLKPSSMIPITGMTGPHEVRYEIATGRITIYSDEGKEITEKFDFNYIVTVYRQKEFTLKRNLLLSRIRSG